MFIICISSEFQVLKNKTLQRLFSDKLSISVKFLKKIPDNHYPPLTCKWTTQIMDLSVPWIKMLLTFIVTYVVRYLALTNNKKKFSCFKKLPIKINIH